LLEAAQELGADYLATGHYARLRREIRNPKSEILNMAKYKNRDQSYFLYRLSQKQLKKIIFPLGNMSKKQVQKIAQQNNLYFKNQKESREICFIPDNDYRKFLENDSLSRYKEGLIKDLKGDVLGQHKGLSFYTIGQRHLGVQSNNTKSLFVVEKRFETNELVVGYDDDPLLFKGEIEVEDVNWIAGQAPDMPLKCGVRLRHRQELQSAQVDAPIRRAGKSTSTKGGYVIRFEKEQRAVASGQFCVFYSPRDEVLRGKKGSLQGEAQRAKTCLGGGVIK